MLSDQRMQPGQSLQPFRKPDPSQPPAALVDQLDVMMVLGPVVPDEQHPPSLDTLTTTRSGEQGPAI
jgi:hypothetical protein